MREPFTQTFGIGDLPRIFPELALYKDQEAILATIFHVIAWQIRLQLLDSNSIHRLCETRYDQEGNEYILYVDRRVVTVTTRSLNVNRNSFTGLSDVQRGQISDRGMFPPPHIFMIKQMELSGSEAHRVLWVWRKFDAFVRATFGCAQWFAKIKQFSRDHIACQSHPWLSLNAEVAAFHGISDPLIGKEGSNNERS